MQLGGQTLSEENVMRMRPWKSHSLSGVSSSNPSLRDQGRGGTKILATSVGGKIAGNQCVPDTAGLTYIWTHKRLLGQAQGLYKSKPGMVLTLSGNIRHKLPSLTQKLSPGVKSLPATQSLLQWSYTDIQTTCNSSSRWPKQNSHWYFQRYFVS